jgi:L-alanine-DL-glutamate epimerase-like enolase superfamily enzyme
VQLALDANNAWSNLPDALRAVERFQPYDPWWIEEPFLPDAAAAFAELAKRTSIPIATGELEATRWPFRQLLEERSVQILQPDVTVCGGVTEWRRIAQMAAGFDTPVAPHWAPEVHAHLVAASPNGLAIEYFTPDFEIVNFDRLLAEPLNLTGGRCRLSDRPGCSPRLDADAVRRHIRHDSHEGAAIPDPGA